MNVKKVIVINQLSKDHLEDICELIGFVLLGFQRFNNSIEIEFIDETIEDREKCLVIRETGEIFILIVDPNKKDLAVNTIPIVFYLKEKNLLND